MSKLLVFEFLCTKCGNSFEDLVDPITRELPCPNCNYSAGRIISAPRLDPKMGLSDDFPTMASKWEKRTRDRAKNDKLTDNPNLWMY